MGVTTTTMAKLGKIEAVYMDILLKMRSALNWGLNDILKIVIGGKND